LKAAAAGWYFRAAMATMITSECINCGACEPECPNTAIYQGGVEWQAPDGTMRPPLSNDIFYIVPEKCTECVGFHDHEACAAVCPVDCCVPNPDIPETHDVLLARARALHPGETIPDDAPSRFRKEGAPAAPAVGPAGPAAPAPAAKPPAAAPAPAAKAPTPAAPAAAPAESVAIAIPAPDDWEIPIRCFRCTGDYSVPFRHFRAGVVFYCPHCQGSLVPTLSMVRAVEEALARFHQNWVRAFDELHERRRRELEQFEERQRAELARFEEELRALAAREKAPGAPTRRRGFFSF
jgi:ferredoxin